MLWTKKKKKRWTWAVLSEIHVLARTVLNYMGCQFVTIGSEFNGWFVSVNIPYGKVSIINLMGKSKFRWTPCRFYIKDLESSIGTWFNKFYSLWEDNVKASTNLEELGTILAAGMFTSLVLMMLLALAGLYIVLVCLLYWVSAILDNPLLMGWTQVSMQTWILEKGSLF